MDKETRVGHGRLFRHLVESAEQYFAIAMQCLSRDDHVGFYMHGGMALEHALKATLAAIHPALIADPKHFESLRTMIQTPEERLPAVHVRTITMTESLERCKVVIPKLAGIAVRLRRMIDNRNGAVHVGLATIDREWKVADSLALFEALDLLLESQSYGRARFYGGFLEAVDARLDQTKAQVEAEVAVAIGAARIQFRERFPHVLPSPNLEEALYHFEFDEGYDVQRITCPACDSTAFLDGDVYPEWTSEPVNDGNAEHACLKVYFLPRSLECKFCGLSLSGRALRAIGVPDELPVDDADPNDFIEPGES